ncbi:MAG: hypothetical protein HY352_03420 [Candidatus Omnitrophica bacterium]|nr:hypothetical protein [Candidatus Omnitrophota bacterium]
MRFAMLSVGAFGDIEDEIDGVSEEPLRQLRRGFDEADGMPAGAQAADDRIDRLLGVELRISIKASLPRGAFAFEVVG